MKIPIRKDIDIAKLTLKENIDINTKKNFSKNAIMYASKYGCIKIDEFLIQNGGIINEKTDWGQTACMHPKLVS